MSKPKGTSVDVELDSSCFSLEPHCGIKALFRLLDCVFVDSD